MSKPRIGSLYQLKTGQQGTCLYLSESGDDSDSFVIYPGDIFLCVENNSIWRGIKTEIGLPQCLFLAIKPNKLGWFTKDDGKFSCFFEEIPTTG